MYCLILSENGKLKFSSTYLTPIYGDRQQHGPIDGSENRGPRYKEENYDHITTYSRESETVGDRFFGGGQNDGSNGSYSTGQQGILVQY